MAEWSNAPVLKTGVSQGTVSSNLTPSAKDMSYIGIDYGTKRVGIAASDGSLALPLEVVPTKEALARVRALAQERNVAVIVIGESKDFKGADNRVMAHIRKFAEELSREVKAEVVLEPEFMTSAAAQSAGASDEMLDASAAAHILQSWLDRQKFRDGVE